MLPTLPTRLLEKYRLKPFGARNAADSLSIELTGKPRLCGPLKTEKLVGACGARPAGCESVMIGNVAHKLIAVKSVNSVLTVLFFIFFSSLCISTLFDGSFPADFLVFLA
jgi:hypothetical protein